MEKLIEVVVKDLDGKEFSREWKSTANRLDVIRWILENGDLPYYVTVEKICSVEVKTKE